MDGPVHPLDLERPLWESGLSMVAGVDEAGRGPLAGPVVAAAVILTPDAPYPGVDDSKKLRPEQRERAFAYICRRARAVCIGLAGQVEIDRINILEASLTAMARAVSDLSPKPDYLLVDGNFAVPLDVPQRAVPHGDALSLSIAAASIVAKVVRDRIMTAYDRRYPEYGFATHKGYGTKAHLRALAEHGPCALHRRSFRGVRPDCGPDVRGTGLIDRA